MKFTSGLLVLLLSVQLYGCSSPPKLAVYSGILPPCGNLPNCVNSQSGRGLQYSPPITAGPEQWRTLTEWISQQQDWQIIEKGGSYVQAVVSTPLLKFKDDVQLLYLPDGELVHVRSASRLGISDLGANAARIQKLRDVAVMAGDY